MPNDVKIIHSSFWSNVFKKKIEHSDLLEILREMPPFAELRNQTLNELVKTMHQRQYVAGEYIFYQNDPGIGLYIVTDGTVQIELKDRQGNIIQLAEFSKGDFFGELALLDGERRTASAKAISDTRVSVLFKPELDTIIDKSPREGVAILSGITKIINTRLLELNEEYLLLYNSYQRLKESNNGTLAKEHSRSD
jgi:CRP-like cAMP-binding protein